MYKFLLAGVLTFTGSTLMAQQQQTEDAASFAKDITRPGVQVFDVRTIREYNTGHLPDALQADYTKKEEFYERVKYLDKQRPVYIYCLSGGRSSAAAKWMRSNGFGEVVELEGGVNAWKQAGNPLAGIQEKQPQLDPAAFQSSISKGIVLVDVGAAWCPPCRQMEPVLTKLLQSRKQVKLVRVDGGNDDAVMKAINAVSLPTFILYRHGKEVWRREGVTELAELQSQIDQH